MRNVVCCFIGSSVLTFSFPAISQSCLKNLPSHHSPFLFNNPLSAIAFTISCITGTGSTRANPHKSLSETSETAARHTDQSCFPSVPYQNSSDVPCPFGTGAHTNIVPSLSGTSSRCCEVRRRMPDFFSHILRTVQALRPADRSVLLPHRTGSAENTIIKLRSHRTEFIYDLLISNHKRNSCTGKVVRLGQRIKLHTDLFLPLRGLKDFLFLRR